MSDFDAEANDSSGIKIPWFHWRRGEDYGLWRLRLRAACRVKGVWNAVESFLTWSVATTTTSSTSEQTRSCRDNIKKDKASRILISAAGNSPLRVVLEANDNPERLLELLDTLYASGRTDTTIAVHTQLFHMGYTDQNMSIYVDECNSLFAQLEQMGKDAAIPELHKAPTLLASIAIKSFLEPTAAALRTKDAPHLTWKYVATTLKDGYNSRHDSTANSSSSKKDTRKQKKKGKALPSSVFRHNNSQSLDSDNVSADIITTAGAFAAALSPSNLRKTTTPSFTMNFVTEEVKLKTSAGKTRKTRRTSFHYTCENF